MSDTNKDKYSAKYPLDEFVHEVNDNAWIIGEAMISRHNAKPSQPYWEDGEGAFFTMTKAPEPKPDTRPLSDSCPITDYLKGLSYGGFYVYKIGQAHLKVTFDTGAQEHNTLEAVAKESFGFQVPTVYCHAVYDEYYYIAHSILPGKTIAEVWPTTKDDAVRKKWTEQIAEAYVRLSEWTSDREPTDNSIRGIDGGNLKDRWPAKTNWRFRSSTDPEVLQKNFMEMGLNCSEIVFAHNHLMPLSFVVDETHGLVGITMWSAAGFVPKDWVLTKAQANPFNQAFKAISHTWSQSDKDDWELKLLPALKAKGFENHWYKYAVWNAPDSRERLMPATNSLNLGQR
ncbi:hypothetical protein FLONG3_5341 [Fusarium longipes]|uniref:Aminoglycoside phosphotransferase domain-containing protein n=1 Tax=Fusarium longipes TaxID=694270 RepID=A0A395SVD7_9HYPO|nr:hypothetical protein FLONG3_5341 [Fusarium longipes]